MSGSLPGTSPAATVVQQFKAPTRIGTSRHGWRGSPPSRSSSAEGRSDEPCVLTAEAAIHDCLVGARYLLEVLGSERRLEAGGHRSADREHERAILLDPAALPRPVKAVREPEKGRCPGELDRWCRA